MPSLGRFIRARRIELGMTQETLAERAGGTIRQADISRLENDRVSLPRKERLKALADALEVPIGTLLIRSGWGGAEDLDESKPSMSNASTGSDHPSLAEFEAVRAEILENAMPAVHEAVAQVQELVDQAEQILDSAQERVEEGWKSA